jgi:hypothetical protein
MDFPYDGTQNLFDMCLAIEAASNVRIMSAAVFGGIATVYYITGDFSEVPQTQAVIDFPWHDYPDFRDESEDTQGDYDGNTDGFRSW